MAVGTTLPLKIALLGVGTRDAAILDLFVRKHCPGGGRLVPEERADLCILDLDGVHGRKLLQQQREQHPRRPLIVLSIREVESDGIVLLRKPTRPEMLKQAIEGCRIELDRRASRAEPAPVPATPPPTASDAPRRRSPVRAGNEVRAAESQSRFAHEYCGLSSPAETRGKAGGDDVYYDPSRLFQRILKSAIDRCRQAERPVRLHLPGGKHITLLPAANLALTDLGDSRLRPRCLLAINAAQTRIEFLQDSESRLLETAETSPQNIDALLWKVALWSARGRLPVGVDMNSKIGLQHWPNLTRLANIPPFLRVAALWVKYPLTLAGTAETLGIEVRYVRAFFSACHALELTRIQAAAAGPGLAVADSGKSPRTGLLGRLLRRLRVA
ncbi:MAG: hypothetical protein P8178_05130 [Candidatus Thiodiazotropha sp.]